MDNDTIAALSTPLGRGGIAVLRISGPRTLPILRRVFEKLPQKVTPRHFYYGYLVDQIDDKTAKRIDHAMAVYFKGPQSYTGEDTAEISIHSNPFLVEEALNLILRDEPDARTALPGEFTYRAFKNGKMDLIQAESVNELINANSRYYAHMKFGSLEGRLSRILRDLKNDLIQLGIQIETKIEFEEDQFFDAVDFASYLAAPLKRLNALLTNARFNDLLDKGLDVVIVGKVNVGKSSLFNTLLMEERSIISHVPGTTRDFIKEKIYIEGCPVEITDVAGFNRNTDCDIETQGIQRGMRKLETCDAVVFMLDMSRPLEETDKEIYHLIKDKKKLLVANKQDIIDTAVLESFKAAFPEETINRVSVKEHINLEAITDFLKGLVGDVKDHETEFTVNRRQKNALEELKRILEGVMIQAESEFGEIEIIAEEIRKAVKVIGSLMGEITADDILNGIFSEFCVGK